MRPSRRGDIGIAVPIVSADQLLGCINIVWRSSAMDETDVRPQISASPAGGRGRDRSTGLRRRLKTAAYARPSIDLGKAVVRRVTRAAHGADRIA